MLPANVVDLVFIWPTCAGQLPAVLEPGDQMRPAALLRHHAGELGVAAHVHAEYGRRYLHVERRGDDESGLGAGLAARVGRGAPEDAAVLGGDGLDGQNWA